MSEMHLSLSEDQRATARYELLSYRRHDNPTCGCLFSPDGELFILISANQQIVAMRSDGTLWPTVVDDVGLIAVDSPSPRPGSGHRRIGRFEKARTPERLTA